MGGALECWPVLFLYIGPQAVLPFLSTLAAAAGVVLMFWHRLAALFRKPRR